MQNLELQLLQSMPETVSPKGTSSSGAPEVNTLTGRADQSSGFASILQGFYNNTTALNQNRVNSSDKKGEHSCPAQSTSKKLFAAIEKIKNGEADPSQIVGDFLQSLTNDEKSYLSSLLSKNGTEKANLNKLINLFQNNKTFNLKDNQALESLLNYMKMAIADKNISHSCSVLISSIQDKLSSAIENQNNTNDKTGLINDFLKSLTDEERKYLNQLISKNSPATAAENKTIEDLLNTLRMAKTDSKTHPAYSALISSIQDKLTSAIENQNNTNDKTGLINDFLKSLTDEERKYLNQLISKNSPATAAENKTIEDLLNTLRMAKTDSKTHPAYSALISSIQDKLTSATENQNNINDKTGIINDFLKLLTDEERKYLSQLISKNRPATATENKTIEPILNNLRNILTKQANQDNSSTSSANTKQGSEDSNKFTQQKINPNSLLYNIIQHNKNLSYNLLSSHPAQTNPLLQNNSVSLTPSADFGNLIIQTIIENSSSQKEALSKIQQMFLNSAYGEAFKEQKISNDRHTNLNSKEAVRIFNAKTEVLNLTQSNSGKNNEKSFENRHNRDDFKNLFNISSTSSSTGKITTAGTITSTTQTHWSSVLEQISGKIQNSLRQGQQTINIQLDPPELGKLQINLTLKANNLQAMIIADSPLTKQLIETNISELRASLENNGLDFGKVSVFVGQNSNPSLFGEKRTMAKNGSNHNNSGTGNNQEGNITSVENERPSVLTKDMVDLFA